VALLTIFKQRREESLPSVACTVEFKPTEIIGVLMAEGSGR
jgi:hypothetical protein